MKNENIKNEQGRSMVEMLGVLAIIGVLSVMGIAGYKAAMTRHRANELLNEATKRAVVVAGQITLNGSSPSLNEFNEKDFSGGSFETTVYGASGDNLWQNATTDKKFTLAITGVDGSICEQMKGVAADNAIIKRFSPDSCDSDNPNTVKLTYNNDLSIDDLPDGNDTPAAEPCPQERQCGDTCCGVGNICVDGNKCCHKDYNGDEEMCCDSSEYVGYSIGYREGPYFEGSCCSNGSIFTTFSSPLGTLSACCETGTGYIDVYISGENFSTSCCDGEVYRRQGSAESYRQGCCPEGSDVSCASKVGDICLEQECCPDGELPVCEYWADETYGCDGSFSCCPIERRTDLGNMAVCCPAGKVGYCYEISEDLANVCVDAGCCAPDKILQGAGYNGGDKCLE